MKTDMENGINSNTSDAHEAEDSFRKGRALIQENGELFTKFQAAGAMPLLQDNQHVLVLVDLSDGVGAGFLESLGIASPTDQLLETTAAVAKEHPLASVRQAATRVLASADFSPKALLLPVPRTKLPDEWVAGVDRPGPLGTFPVFVLGAGQIALMAWAPGGVEVEA